MKQVGNNQPVEPGPLASLRPLSARSVIASTLLGTRPPSLPGRQLVRSCEILGIAGGTARVAMTRMVATGELAMEDGRYTLIGPLRERQLRQDESLQGVSDREADSEGGTWSLFVIIGGGPRSAAERSMLRTTLLRYRYGEVREGLWSRPANLSTLDQARSAIAPHASHWRATPDHALSLVGAMWDLASWSNEAQRLRDAMTRGQRDLNRSRSDTLPENFALDAAVIRHLQADPLLPPTLLPADWPGRDLRLERESFDAAFNRVWRAALRFA